MFSEDEFDDSDLDLGWWFLLANSKRTNFDESQIGLPLDGSI